MIPKSKDDWRLVLNWLHVLKEADREDLECLLNLYKAKQGYMVKAMTNIMMGKPPDIPEWAKKDESGRDT